MAELKAEVLIDRPVEEVMGFLADLENHPRFLPEEFSEFGFPGRTSGKGATMRLRWQHGKATEDLLLEVVKADENNLVLKSTLAGSQALGLWYWVQGNELGSYVKLVVERAGSAGGGGLFRRKPGVLDGWKKALPKLRDLLSEAAANNDDADSAGAES